MHLSDGALLPAWSLRFGPQWWPVTLLVYVHKIWVSEWLLHAQLVAKLWSLLQSHLGYGDIFTDTWKAFTDHPIIPLRNYANKRVCYRQCYFYIVCVFVCVYYKLEMLQSLASELPWYMLKVVTVHYLNVVKVIKVSQGHPKLLLVQHLHYTYQAAKNEVYL